MGTENNFWDNKEKFFENSNITEECRQYFKLITKYENILHKDLKDFNVTELLESYNSLDNKNKYKLMSIHSAFEHYIDWAYKSNLIKEGLDAKPHILEIYSIWSDKFKTYDCIETLDNLLELEDTINKTILDFKEKYQKSDELDAKHEYLLALIDKYKVNKRDILVLVLSHLGLIAREIFELKWEDIDYSKNIINVYDKERTHIHKTYIINGEITKLLMQVKDEKDYCMYTTDSSITLYSIDNSTYVVGRLPGMHPTDGSSYSEFNEFAFTILKFKHMLNDIEMNTVHKYTLNSTRLSGRYLKAIKLLNKSDIENEYEILKAILREYEMHTNDNAIMTFKNDIKSYLSVKSELES